MASSRTVSGKNNRSIKIWYAFGTLLDMLFDKIFPSKFIPDNGAPPLRLFHDADDFEGVLFCWGFSLWLMPFIDMAAASAAAIASSVLWWRRLRLLLLGIASSEIEGGTMVKTVEDRSVIFSGGNGRGVLLWFTFRCELFRLELKWLFHAYLKVTSGET